MLPYVKHVDRSHWIYHGSPIEGLKMKGKYSKVNYKYLTYKGRKEGSPWVFYGCTCGKVLRLSASTITGTKDKGQLEDLHCGCLTKEGYTNFVESVIIEFKTKRKISDQNPQYCTYCESYREERDTRYCKCCTYVQKLNLRVGQSFEDIMNSWDKSYEIGECAKLPVLKGNSSKGYEVVSITLLDLEWYENASKLMWIEDAAGYVRSSYSKSNMRRLGVVLDKSVKGGITLHRFVKGVSNEVPLHVDHINGNPKDNRLENLRFANCTQNVHNSLKRGANKYSSKYKGVIYCLGKESKKGKKNKVWKSTLVRGTHQNVKWCYTEKEAAEWYDEVLRNRYPSEFNVYNFPREGERSAIQD
tara:strand:- start:294 stop:1367 length:1074 start_codon:yes stop_codon:yes gene_type:complete